MAVVQNCKQWQYPRHTRRHVGEPVPRSVLRTRREHNDNKGVLASETRGQRGLGIAHSLSDALKSYVKFIAGFLNYCQIL